MTKDHQQFGFQPACRELLDPSAATSLLRESVPFRQNGLPYPVDVRVERVWPDRAGGLVVEWSFELQSTLRYSLYGAIQESKTGDRESTQQKDVKSSCLRIASGVLCGVDVYLPQFSLVIQSPDCDPVLGHLESCLDGARVARFLAETVEQGEPKAPSVEIEACNMIGYRYGRRATIAYRCRCGDGEMTTLIGKTFRDDRGMRLFDRQMRLEQALRLVSGGRVTVPKPLAFLDELRMIVYPKSLDISGSETQEESDEVTAPAVEALAALHRSSLDGLPVFTTADESKIVRRWWNVLRTIDPSRAAGVEDLIQRLETFEKTVTQGDMCTIHRDFYQDQLLIAEDRYVILDLDTLASGSPCVDLGNYIAHVVLARVQSGAAMAGMLESAQQILARYEEIGSPVDPDALRFYTASSLFRLGAVHAFRTLTGQYAEQLWEVARHVLDMSACCWKHTNPTLSDTTVPGARTDALEGVRS